MTLQSGTPIYVVNFNIHEPSQVCGQVMESVKNHIQYVCAHTVFQLVSCRQSSIHMMCPITDHDILQRTIRIGKIACQ